MFKFDFDIDTEEPNFGIANPPNLSSKIHQLENFTGSQSSFGELSLSQLLDTLPSLISYSPLYIPLSSSRKSVTLIRRDLFDARFQLISEFHADDSTCPHSQQNSQVEVDDKALGFLDNPSDLVPGIYEGGLKTWECSLDLVDYLDSLKDRSDFQGFYGSKVLELGCGTGVPSLYIFQELLSTSYDSCMNSQKTEIHLQDYNEFVIQLITMPNLLATWYASPHSSSYRESVDDPEVASLIDPALPGELSITSDFKKAFVSSLESLNITFRFFVGPWAAFNPLTSARTYNLLLTSETIYRLDSLRSLIDLMRIACTGRVSETILEKCNPSHLRPSDNSVASDRTSTAREDYLCLVAAKVLYFGVGGGLPDFVEEIQKVGGMPETVLERRVGVGRKVIRVHW